jgi:hypothetical protein
MLEKKDAGHGEFYDLNNGEFVFWVDGGLMIKVRGMSGDPLEISISEAIKLAEAMLKLAKEND